MITRTVETRKEEEETPLAMPLQKTQMRRMHTFAFKIDFSKQQNVEIFKLLVDCGATSHIIIDIYMFHKLDESFKADKHYIEVANGERSNTVALKRGTADMKIVDSRGECVEIPHFHKTYFQFKLPLIKEPVYLFNQTVPNFH